jgi:hypothetical protein
MSRSLRPPPTVGNGHGRMTRFEIDAFLDRLEDSPRVQRLAYFMHAVTEDRILQLSISLAVASLWFALAFADGRFLVLFPVVVVAVRRFRRLERNFAPDDDDWL